MQSLTLNVNKLSGKIPLSLGNLSKLFQLDLSHNMLEGNIPPSIGNCKNLQYLDLSDNIFGGAIPSEVFGIPYLSLLLNLSHNSFTGGLPIEVGNLKSISKFDFSRNSLFGEIPGTVGECIVLEYLNLQGNSFQGTIPYNLASLRGLQYLDLSENKLSGSIPKGLEDIPVLLYLNVSFNMLDGEVPTRGIFRNMSSISLEGNNELCGGITTLHLPPCPEEIVKKHNKHHTWKILLIVISGFLFLLLLLSFGAMYRKRKISQRSSSTSLTMEGNQLSKVSYQTLHKATDGFSSNNLIGSGAFGFVYNGNFESESRIVAIKVLNLQKKGSQKSFVAECNALRNTRHRNLVKILTCCSSMDFKGDEFKALVFEFMENGSLEKWLHPEFESEDRSRTLDLFQRLNIAIDVGSALEYLHHENEQRIVHCDLKPSNVLLNSDMVAHVGDFGLAKLLWAINGISQNQSSTIGLKGTIGYAPPEYGTGGEVSTQGDVYSFGILLLEMLTGRRPTDEMFTDGINLHKYVKIALPDKLLQVVDPALLRELKGKASPAEEKGEQHRNDQLSQMHMEKCLLELFHIGLACSAESPKERMDVRDVTRELDLIKSAFLVGRRMET